MPTYEYVCTACGRETEVFQSIKAEPLVTCEACGKRKLKRKIGTGGGIIFKGTGFYQTDYKPATAPKESKPSAAKAEAPAAPKAEAKPKAG